VEAIGSVLGRLGKTRGWTPTTGSGAGSSSTAGREHSLKATSANTSMTTLDPDKIYHTLLEAGQDWADKESAADLLEETKKVVLADMQSRQGEAKSVAAAEALALCKPQYLEHLKAMTEARRVANRARVQYDSLKALMELRRSQESTRRAEASIR